MKKLLSTILASTMILSTLGTSFATEQGTVVEHLQPIQTETLGTPVVPDPTEFTFSGGVVYNYTGDATSIIIPETIYGMEVTNIGQLNAPHLVSVQLHDGIVSIHDRAFMGHSLQQIVIPDSVVYVGKNAFGGCTQLTSLKLSENLAVIEEEAFYNCSSLTSVTLPDSVTTISYSAFQQCTGLKNIHFPSGAFEIRNNAFLNCTSLEYMVLPSRAYYEDASSIFKGCTSLKTVVLEEGFTKINAFMFSDCTSLRWISFPSTLTYVATAAFGNTPSLEQIYVPPTLTGISSSSFRGGHSEGLTIYGELGTQAPALAASLSVPFVEGFPTNVDLSTPSDTTTETTPNISGYPDWATSFISFVSGEIMPDITPENYNSASNRGLIAQSFYNMSGNGANVTASHSFTDVGDFGTAIAWCYEKGVMSGTGNTTFGSYGNVNREQFCLILKQMASVLGIQTESGSVSALSSFSDVDAISSWAAEGVAWAVANDLMAGSNGAMNPQGDVTRLEVAIMLAAFDNL